MDDEYEISITDYLAVLWSQKWIIIITFLVAVITAIAISYSLPRQYQAQTSLLILPPLSRDVSGEVTGTVYSPETYRRLALAGDLLQAVIAKAYPQGGGPSAASLRSGISVEVEQTTARDFPGRFPLLLRVAFSGSDPEGLVRQAGAWTQVFIEKNAALFLDRTAQSLEYISQTFAEVERDLRAQQGTFMVFQRESLEPLLEAEVASLEMAYRTYLGALATQRQALAAAEARAAALESALGEEPLRFTLESGPSEEALWQFIGTRPAARDLAGYTGLTLQTEVLNNAYVELRGLLAVASAERAALAGEVAFLESEIAETRREIEAKRERLVEVAAERVRFEQEIAVLTQTYTRVAAKLQDARIARAETAEPIRVVEAAILPTIPVGPNRRMNIAVAGVLGLFLGVLVAFIAHHFQQRPSPTPGSDLHS